jgi:hypothetical protein
VISWIFELDGDCLVRTVKRYGRVFLKAGAARNPSALLPAFGMIFFVGLRASTFRACRSNRLTLRVDNSERSPAMVFVEVRVHPIQPVSHMATLRIWLASKDIDTAGFTHNATARLAFRAETEAEAIAARFSGRVMSRAASAVEVAPSLPRLSLLSLE